MFSPEVNEMRSRIRDFGGVSKALNRIRRDNYKQQALFELAARLYLEDELAQLERNYGKLVDRLEAADLPATV